jgi:outer membrane immunogenic protein
MALRNSRKLSVCGNLQKVTDEFEGIQRRMKKTMLLLGALMLSAAAGYAQESRQDVSVSGSVAFAPQITGNSVQKNTSMTVGLLASYRYLLTPRSALEANYGYAQNTQYYQVFGKAYGGIHVLQQEFSVAYVYNLNFKNFNPFLEAGPGAMIFDPLKDAGTTNLDAKRTTGIGGVFGGGVAYELSPSFDIRAEYRGFLVKTPNFGVPGNIFNTNRYEVVSSPSIGVAYHF